MSDPKEQQKVEEDAVDKDAREDLELNDEDANKVVGGGIVHRKAGELPIEA